jgi:RNA 2',3'-cyclic 3'-phosphodiesterase
VSAGRPERAPREQPLRLFVALDVPDRVVSDLAAAVDAVRAEHPRLRWVPAPRWHLTLAFLGAVDVRKVDDLCTRLGRAARRYPPLPLELGGAGRFGDRVLWVGVRGAVADVGRLAASVAAGSRRAGIAVEDRPYRPHLTLARGRDGVDLRPAVAALAAYTGPAWTAAEVHLVRSHLGRDVRYERLASFVLGGPPVTPPVQDPPPEEGAPAGPPAAPSA